MTFLIKNMSKLNLLKIQQFSTFKKGFIISNSRKKTEKYKTFQFEPEIYNFPIKTTEITVIEPTNEKLKNESLKERPTPIEVFFLTF